MDLARRSAKNTLGCLIGCAIGDLGAIFCFQIYYSPDGIPRELWTLVWGVAMGCGIFTSIILETIILWKQLGPKEAFRTAIGMSLISMILMEIAMNLADYGMMGEPAITLAVLPVTLGLDFLQLGLTTTGGSKSMESVATKVTFLPLPSLEIIY